VASIDAQGGVSGGGTGSLADDRLIIRKPSVRGPPWEGEGRTSRCLPCTVIFTDPVLSAATTASGARRATGWRAVTRPVVLHPSDARRSTGARQLSRQVVDMMMVVGGRVHVRLGLCLGRCLQMRTVHISSRRHHFLLDLCRRERHTLLGGEVRSGGNLGVLVAEGTVEHRHCTPGTNRAYCPPDVPTRRPSLNENERLPMRGDRCEDALVSLHTSESKSICSVLRVSASARLSSRRLEPAQHVRVLDALDALERGRIDEPRALPPRRVVPRRDGSP
jgi:hypothetical protein